MEELNCEWEQPEYKKEMAQTIFAEYDTARSE